jgi:DNA-binding response OmpR family regulator
MTTILIMEDDPHQSRLMRRLLEHAGYDVLVAPDGESGLRTAMTATPDLILLDMGLPDLDGQTVAGLIKGSTLLSKTPLVAVTAWPQDFAAEMAAAYGCDGYLSKPISAREFAEQVAGFLGAPDEDADGEETERAAIDE